MKKFRTKLAISGNKSSNSTTGRLPVTKIHNITSYLPNFLLPSWWDFRFFFALSVSSFFIPPFSFSLTEAGSKRLYDNDNITFLIGLVVHPILPEDIGHNLEASFLHLLQFLHLFTQLFPLNSLILYHVLLDEIYSLLFAVLFSHLFIGVKALLINAGLEVIVPETFDQVEFKFEHNDSCWNFRAFVKTLSNFKLSYFTHFA